jgi:hypothetical protein
MHPIVGEQMKPLKEWLFDREEEKNRSLRDRDSLTWIGGAIPAESLFIDDRDPLDEWEEKQTACDERRRKVVSKESMRHDNEIVDPMPRLRRNARFWFSGLARQSGQRP